MISDDVIEKLVDELMPLAGEALKKLPEYQSRIQAEKDRIAGVLRRYLPAPTADDDAVVKDVVLHAMKGHSGQAYHEPYVTDAARLGVARGKARGVAHERERCGKVADKHRQCDYAKAHPLYFQAADSIADEIERGG